MPDMVQTKLIAQSCHGVRHFVRRKAKLNGDIDVVEAAFAFRHLLSSVNSTLASEEAVAAGIAVGCAITVDLGEASVSAADGVVGEASLSAADDVSAAGDVGGEAAMSAAHDMDLGAAAVSAADDVDLGKVFRDEHVVHGQVG